MRINTTTAAAGPHDAAAAMTTAAIRGVASAPRVT